MTSDAYYELRESDIDQPHIRAFGRAWRADSFIGRVLPGDVGKRVYRRGDIVQVENDEQRDKRLAREHNHD